MSTPLTPEQQTELFVALRTLQDCKDSLRMTFERGYLCGVYSDFVFVYLTQWFELVGWTVTNVPFMMNELAPTFIPSIRWRARWSDEGIERIEIESETKTTVTFLNGETTHNGNIYKTWKKAHAAIVRDAQRGLNNAKDDLKKAEYELHRVRTMKEPTDTNKTGDSK